MKMNEYKSICQRPDVFNRAVIEATERTVKTRDLPLTLRLKEILKNTPVSKPLLYDGDKITDYFFVTCDVSEAEQITEHLVEAEAEAINFDGTTTPQASHFAELANAWMSYINYRGKTVNKM